MTYTHTIKFLKMFFHFVFSITHTQTFSNKNSWKLLIKCIRGNSLFSLIFFIESSIDRPLATYRPRDQFVHIGDHARFYCEAFIGNLGIPDAKSTLKWYQVFDESQEHEIKDGYQDLITR